MVQITNGQQTLEVTRGVFEETYAPLGYTEVSGGEAQTFKAAGDIEGTEGNVHGDSHLTEMPDVQSKRNRKSE